MRTVFLLQERSRSSLRTSHRVGLCPWEPPAASNFERHSEQVASSPQLQARRTATSPSPPRPVLSFGVSDAACISNNATLNIDNPKYVLFLLLCKARTTLRLTNAHQADTVEIPVNGEVQVSFAMDSGMSFTVSILPVLIPVYLSQQARDSTLPYLSSLPFTLRLINECCIVDVACHMSAGTPMPSATLPLIAAPLGVPQTIVSMCHYAQPPNFRAM